MTATIIATALISTFVGLTVREHYTLKIQALRRDYEAMLDDAADVIADVRPPLVDGEILTIPPRAVDWQELFNEVVK